MKIKELEDVIFENYYRRIGFPKKTLFNEISKEKRLVVACN